MGEVVQSLAPIVLLIALRTYRLIFHPELMARDRAAALRPIE